VTAGVPDGACDAVHPAYWERTLTLRIAMAACYVALAPAGVLPMSTAWWVASGWSVLAYSLVLWVLYRRYGLLSLHRDWAPFIDALMMTLAIVAVARPDYPIWVGFFLIISSLSALHSLRYILAFAAWTCVLLWAGDYVVDLGGRAGAPWDRLLLVSGFSVFMALTADTLATSNRFLRESLWVASMTDPLTGLHNRRRFGDVVSLHDPEAARPRAVVMYDLDNFKALNEAKGHVYADTVLVRVAAALRSSLRDADSVARYGGDELIALAPVDSIEEAVALAERSRAHVLEQAGVSLSVGVGVYPLTARTLEAAVGDADAALGRAKQAGKARVVAARAA
jgi:diguanylate cyclase (GGDEF)-like protein